MNPDPEWLLEVYELDKTPKGRNNGAYVLMKNMDELMHQGRFDFIDERLLRDMVVEDISVSFMIGLLTCSAWCVDKLKHRTDFVKRVRKELEARKRTDIEALLRGLE